MTNSRSALPPLGALALSLALLGLGACAPALVGRPAIPMPETHRNEIGVAGGVSAGPSEMSPVVQAWFAHRFNHLELSTLAYYSPTGIGLGTQLRSMGTFGPVSVGGDLEVGLLWGAVGLPVSLNLGDRVWLWTRPSVGVYSGSDGTESSEAGTGGYIPVGVTTKAGPLLIGLEFAMPYGATRKLEGSLVTNGIDQKWVGGLDLTWRL